LGRKPLTYEQTEAMKDLRKTNKSFQKEIIEHRRLLELDRKMKSAVIYSVKSKGKKKDREATAVILYSDGHIEEKITRSSVNGLNEYNPAIAKERSDFCFINARKLIAKERQDVKISDVVLGLLGDNIHGLIHESYAYTNYMTPQEASIMSYELIVSGMNHLLEDKLIKKLTVVCKVGNHSRSTLKPFSDNEALMSYEWGIYKNIERHFKDNPRVDIILENSYFTYLSIYDKVFRFHHGHNIKYGGGVGGMVVPLSKFIYRANEQIKADIDCIGHFHTRIALPNVFINGCLCGFGTYALKIGARPEPPVQSFFLVDKHRGVTVTAPILLEEV